MAGIARSIRFLVGVAMVAGGATLAAPVCTRLVTLAAAHWGGGSGDVQPAAPAAGPMPAAGVPMPQPPAPPPTLAVGLADMPPAAPPVAAEAAVSAAVPPLDRDYRPPTPPTPLPGLPAEFLVPGPQVGSAYRSTLEVPPPPLLDSQQPPPLAAAWSAHSVSAAAPPAPPQVSDVPQTYRVKDGDDLTSIATRFYGHPGAAATIWEANRGTITDPSLLPIGAELRLPASWAAGGPLGTALAGRAIEPPATTLTDTAAGPRAAPVSWLGAGGRPSAGVAPGQPAAPPRSVRVAPGETLATLAARFYGDASQANRIWEANRDQLRSPELVVAGMELRLP
jgi:nucleoid-associated protein YgaU